MWHGVVRMFQRPALALILAVLAGLGVTSVALRLYYFIRDSVTETCKWLWNKAWEYGATLAWVSKWLAYISMGVAVGLWLFLDPIAKETEALDSVLDYSTLVLSKVTAGVGYGTARFLAVAAAWTNPTLPEDMQVQVPTPPTKRPRVY